MVKLLNMRFGGKVYIYATSEVAPITDVARIAVHRRRMSNSLLQRQHSDWNSTA